MATQTSGGREGAGLPGRESTRLTQASRRSKSDRRLIGAALKLIAVNGADRTSLAEIGTAAGYSRGLPGERFGSKQAMLETIVDNMSDWFAQGADEVRGDRRGLAAIRARLAAHFDAVTNAADATRTLETLYVESLGPIPELKPRMMAFSAELISGLAQHFAEAQELDEIDGEIDCVALAETCLCTMRGIVLQSFFHDDGGQRLQVLRAQYLRILECFLSESGKRNTDKDEMRPLRAARASK